MTEPGRNDPCTCGSGRKYKACCLHRRDAAPTGAARNRELMQTTPPAPPAARTYHGKTVDALATCLDAAAELLDRERALTVKHLLDRVLAQLQLAPNFTYGDFVRAMAADGRFTVKRNELCARAGDDPIKLYVDKLGL